MPPLVSIIIPLYRDTKEFRQCISECLKLGYTRKEIIVVSDFAVELPKEAKLVLTGRKQTGPAEKRDLALKRAKGELCAFIDDDAFPRSDWLSNAVKYFDDTSIAAVGGPGLTPGSNSFLQKLGGAFFESAFGSALMTHRFRCEPNRFTDDLPAYNLVMRKKSLLGVGGFSSTFYGGEDTKLCLALAKSGKKILYAGDVVVFHHRRAFPLKHLKQVWNVGKHRGYFVKAFPETSMRFVYFLPSIGTAALLAVLLISFFEQKTLPFLAVALIFYYAVIFFSSLRKGFFIAAFLPFVVLLSHIAYGVGFIKGVITQRLER